MRVVRVALQNRTYDIAQHAFAVINAYGDKISIVLRIIVILKPKLFSCGFAHDASPQQMHKRAGGHTGPPLRGRYSYAGINARAATQGRPYESGITYTCFYFAAISSPAVFFSLNTNSRMRKKFAMKSTASTVSLVSSSPRSSQRCSQVTPSAEHSITSPASRE